MLLTKAAWATFWGEIINLSSPVVEDFTLRWGVSEQKRKLQLQLYNITWKTQFVKGSLENLSFLR